jgi:hypothetical protein
VGADKSIGQNNLTAKLGRSELPKRVYLSLRPSEQSIRGILMYCARYHYSQWIAVNAGARVEDVRLSNLEARFVCKACGDRGAMNSARRRDGFSMNCGGAYC